MERSDFEIYEIDVARVLEVYCDTETPLGYGACELLLVLSGAVRLSSGLLLSSDELTVLPPHEHVSIRAENGRLASVMSISFRSRLEELCFVFGRAFRLTDKGRAAVSLMYSEIAGTLDSVINGVSAEYPNGVREYSFASEKLFKNSLENLLILVIRAFRKEDVIPELDDDEPITLQAHAVRRYAKENYTSRVTLDNLCYLFRTNKTTICREFKREYGITVLEYVNGLRIREARRLIAESEISVTEISERLGFESVHYFCRLFKKTVGKTPTEYKKSVKARMNLFKGR